MLRCEWRRATFDGEDSDGRPDAIMAEAIETALGPSVQLHMYPKSVIDIAILVLQDDGGALSAAISAASLALADARIALFGLVASATVGLDRARGRIVLDPEQPLESIMVALIPGLNEVTQTQIKGRFTVNEMAEAVQVGLNACHLVHDVMRKTAVTAFTKEKAKSNAEGAEEGGKTKKKRKNKE
jgi:ribonuclease PH